MVDNRWSRFYWPAFDSNFLERTTNEFVVDNFLVSSEAEYQNNFSYTNLNKNLIDTQLNNHELVVGDICDAELARKVCKGIDIIVHLAANTEFNLLSIHQEMTFLIIAWGHLTILRRQRLRGLKNLFLHLVVPFWRC